MSKILEFTYHRYLGKDPKTNQQIEKFRPTLPIRISKGDKSSFYFQALIDSGSDRNLFPAGIAEFVGINVSKGGKREIEGIGGHVIRSYTHSVLITIWNSISFETEIDFSYDHQFPLLGRHGFFDKFKKISFREKKRTIEFKT